MKTKRFEALDHVLTMNLGEDWMTCEQITSDIIEQKRDYGFDRVILFFPNTGTISEPLPGEDYFAEGARRFAEIREAVKPHGVHLGWWIRTSINTGHTPGIQRLVGANGAESVYSNCPLDRTLQERFSKLVALFTDIGRPEFIFFEDDMVIGGFGCFCERHLDAFAKKIGKRYTREELAPLLNTATPEHTALLREWRTLMAESLAEFAAVVRAEVDRVDSAIPIGHMQPGCSDMDGDSILPVSRALAGKNHLPHSRIMSSPYGMLNQSARAMPRIMFNALYKRQHIEGDFGFYHETDPYPHTRFFKSGYMMRAIGAIAYSYGYDGSILNFSQFADDQNEEKVYSRMFSLENKRFNAVYDIASQCERKGVRLGYDPFFNSLDGWIRNPQWMDVLIKFGIPYTTLDSDIIFMDATEACYATEEQLLRALSKTVFLDGDAAQVLCDRGYGTYLGVTLHGNLCGSALYKTGNPDSEPITYDIGAREVIRDAFVPEGKGHNMITPFMYSPTGYGDLKKLEVTDPKTEIITEFCDHNKNYISTTMTYFENALGGKVTVMAITLDGNGSHSLINYRRQRIFTQLLERCGAEIPFVSGDPEVFTIVNEPVVPEESDFIGMLTLINLSEDPLDEVHIRLPEKWTKLTALEILDVDGSWQKVDFTCDGKLLTVKETLAHLVPMYLFAK